MGLENQVSVKKSDCLGMCGKAPSVYVKKLKLSYKLITTRDCRDLLRRLFSRKQAVLPSTHVRLPE